MAAAEAARQEAQRREAEAAERRRAAQAKVDARAKLEAAEAATKVPVFFVVCPAPMARGRMEELLNLYYIHWAGLHIPLATTMRPNPSSAHACCSLLHCSILFGSRCGARRPRRRSAGASRRSRQRVRRCTRAQPLQPPRQNGGSGRCSRRVQLPPTLATA